MSDKTFTVRLAGVVPYAVLTKAPEMHAAAEYDAYLADEPGASFQSPFFQRSDSPRFALGVVLFAMAVQVHFTTSCVIFIMPLLPRVPPCRTTLGPQPRRIRASSLNTSQRAAPGIVFPQAGLAGCCRLPRRFGLMKFLKKRKLRKGTEHLSEAPENPRNRLQCCSLATSSTALLSGWAGLKR